MSEFVGKEQGREQRGRKMGETGEERGVGWQSIAVYNETCADTRFTMTIVKVLVRGNPYILIPAYLR